MGGGPRPGSGQRPAAQACWELTEHRMRPWPGLLCGAGTPGLCCQIRCRASLVPVRCGPVPPDVDLAVGEGCQAARARSHRGLHATLGF